ncbi:MAG: DegT/DnrJ/EryC1/StrS family aminotransferase [Candidatus Bathyarchaeota archaeon]|nr:DegT/DnrJ/EryC1/StrS family aminotransferase [Candidatus Bathyarchaeota archaeon]
MRIPLAKPVFDEEMKSAAVEALQNEKFVMGESVFKFEEEFAQFCGVKHAVSTSSGTFALQLALQALGVNCKDKVVTTPFSFIATANSIYCAGSTPVFADVNPKNCNIDPQYAKQVLSNEVKALMPVHLYGYPADLDSIMDLAEDGKRVVVEDCCQAHGAKYGNRKVGSFGSVGCFSFYSAKNMTVGGDGGMAVTNNEEVANHIAKLRDCGRISHYEHDLIGVTARLNSVNAAIGRVQLRKLEDWNNKRRAAARLYNKLLSDLDEVELPPSETAELSPVYHLYAIKSKRRDTLKAYLEGKGIQCGIHYPIPIHLQPIYRQLYGYKEGDFPNSEGVSKKVLSLPMYPELEPSQIEQVSQGIHEFCSQTLT